MPKISNHEKKPKHIVVPLHLPAELRSQIKTAASKSGLSEADVMRLAIKRGIGAIENLFSKPEEHAA